MGELIKRCNELVQEVSLTGLERFSSGIPHQQRLMVRTSTEELYA